MTKRDIVLLAATALAADISAIDSNIERRSLQLEIDDIETPQFDLPPDKSSAVRSLVLGYTNPSSEPEKPRRKFCHNRRG